VWDWSEDAGLVVERLAQDSDGGWHALVDRRPAVGLARRWVALPDDIEVSGADAADLTDPDLDARPALYPAGTSLARWGRTQRVVVLGVERGEEGHWMALVQGPEPEPRWVEVPGDVEVKPADLAAGRPGAPLPGQLGLGVEVGGSKRSLGRDR
jgi:hypothetical protein